MIINTNDYIKVYHNCFDKKILKNKTEEAISTTHWEPHFWSDTVTGEKSSRSKKELESHKGIRKHHKYFMDTLHGYIGQYMKDVNNRFLGGWAGYSQITYHRYKKGTDMAPHVDHIQSIFDGERKGIPILSVVGQLNENFSGGEFVIEDKSIKMKAGDVLIFPSNFLFSHRVNTITKGTRLSFISWVY